ncbi:MAG: 4Fe-4S dicluster domain-containing protein [bacterium]|nr:4Fe-4S dicluster domain-containing protein [bacterium]
MKRRRFLLAGIGVAAGAGVGAVVRAVRDDGGPSLLRPPGALPEPQFLAACIRCGQCIEACPPEFATLHMFTARPGARFGTPYVDSRHTPCRLCASYDELKCIEACPTAALSPVEEMREIRMGTAVIDRELCLAYNGVVCRACWHICPFPNEAIRFDERLRPVVVEEACIGCGLCDWACPTEETSIPVRPAAAADAETT